MVEKSNCVARLSRVFCSTSVQAVLDQAGLTPEALLQVHRRTEDTEASTDKPDWKCTPFDLERSQQTVWVITDPQQQTTMLLLEGP